MLFFVSVGMLFDPQVLVERPLQVLAVVAIIVLGKSLAAAALVPQAASMSGVPFAVVRAISDLADGTAAASFEQFEQHAADVSAAAVLQALALLD